VDLEDRLELGAARFALLAAREEESLDFRELVEPRDGRDVDAVELVDFARELLGARDEHVGRVTADLLARVAHAHDRRGGERQRGTPPRAARSSSIGGASPGS
jgi:hypothetical protein